MNRREFLKTFGQGLLGLGVAAASPGTVVKAIAAGVGKEGVAGGPVGGNDVSPNGLGQGSTATMKCYEINTDSMIYRNVPSGMVDELVSRGWE